MAICTGDYEDLDAAVSDNLGAFDIVTLTYKLQVLHHI